MSLTAYIRNYWNRQPCNIRHGQRGDHLPMTPEWSQDISARRYHSEPHILEFAQFKRWANRDVLEIGCGIGSDALEFIKAGARLDAVDLSRASLDVFKRRLELEGLHARALVCCDAMYSLPGRRNDYDLIYSFGALHHLQDPYTVLRKSWRRLRSGGELRIMLYAKHSLKTLQRRQPEAQANCPLVRWYSRRGAQRLVEEAGFKSVYVQRRHIFRFKISEYSRGVYVERWLSRRFWPDHWQGLERWLGEHYLITAVKK